MYARVVRSSVPTRWAHLFRHLFAACQARAASTLERVTSQSRVARNQGGHQEDVPRRWGFIRRVRPKNIVTCRREALPPRASPPGAWDAQVRLKVRPLIVFFSTLSFSGIARLSTCSQLDARRRMRVCSWLLVAWWYMSEAKGQAHRIQPTPDEEMWGYVGYVGICGDMWGYVARCGEMWGDDEITHLHVIHEESAIALD